jgi:glutathione transport system ATP-binding protein
MLLRRRNRQVIDLNELSGAQMQGVRGADMAMIFQEPMTSLNPVFPVGEQIAESIRLHQGLSGDEALREAKRMLEQVRIPEAQAILALSASAFRRHAPAGDDCHGALLPSGGADCR